jgi:hypothetical protein
MQENDFRLELRLESPDLEAYGLTDLLQHPDLVILMDNGPGGVLSGAPISMVVERHLVDQAPSAPQVSLTMEELLTLRDYLNEAIIYAEGLEQAT